MQILTSPYIIKLYSTSKDDEFLYFHMEAALGGPLHKQLRQNIGVYEAIAYTSELVSALFHMGARGVIHRDIKLNNCLLDSKGHVKLCDFGSSKVLFDTGDCQVSTPKDSLPPVFTLWYPVLFDASHPKGPFSPRKNHASCPSTYTVIGTAPFMAPELRTRTGYSLNADWFSLGVVFFEMVTGTHEPCQALSTCTTGQRDWSEVCSANTMHPKPPQPNIALFEKQDFDRFT